MAQKLKEATHEIDEGTYVAPNRMTVGEWMDIWSRDFLGNVKSSTRLSYNANIRRYIKPAMGAVKLADLQPHTVQQFINGVEGLAPGTVCLAFRVLNMALSKAVRMDYITRNPATYCELPRSEREEIRPLDVPAFLEAIKGDRFETLFKVTLFTGMRLGEIMGLLWECVDFQSGTITIDKQLRLLDHEYRFMSPKNGKPRTVMPASWVMKLLRQHEARQAAQRLKVG